MKVSKHASKRMRERLGIKEKSQNRIAKKAFYYGLTHAQTKGRLNRWITHLYFKNQNANNIRVYGDIAYIFCGETLATVIRVPADIKEDMKNMIKPNRR